MDRFETLRAFVQVVENGSLTRAAETLDVATSAVSRRIKELEERLGVQLLQRTTRQMRLTAAGETFHARAQEILQALEEAESEAGSDARVLHGTLRIAAPLSFGLGDLTPILIDFAKAHPDVKLDLDFSDRMVDLVAEGHDLAVRIGNLADSSLIARKLVEFPMTVCASPDFWARHGRPVTPEDLRELPALCYNGSERGDLWRYTGPDGREGSVEVKPVMRATSGTFLMNAGIAGLGVVRQPQFIVKDALAAGALVPVLEDYGWPTVTAYAVYPQTRHLSARARAFMEFARQHVSGAIAAAPSGRS